jgi:hypothetical protein
MHGGQNENVWLRRQREERSGPRGPWVGSKFQFWRVLFTRKLFEQKWTLWWRLEFKKRKHKRRTDKSVVLVDERRCLSHRERLLTHNDCGGGGGI